MTAAAGAAPSAGLLLRAATAVDLPAITGLLSAVRLDGSDVAKWSRDFLVAELEGRIVGTIGLESYGKVALLRSATVAPEARGRQIGRRLVEAVEARARRLGVEMLVLLTTDAAGYFAKCGFAEVQRSEITGDILRSRQFSGACPASATVMRKPLR